MNINDFNNSDELMKFWASDSSDDIPKEKKIDFSSEKKSKKKSVNKNEELAKPVIAKGVDKILDSLGLEIRDRYSRRQKLTILKDYAQRWQQLNFGEGNLSVPEKKTLIALQNFIKNNNLFITLLKQAFNVKTITDFVNFDGYGQEYGIPAKDQALSNYANFANALNTFSKKPGMQYKQAMKYIKDALQERNCSTRNAKFAGIQHAFKHRGSELASFIAHPLFPDSLYKTMLVQALLDS